MLLDQLQATERGPLDFERDLHVEARTVLGRSPQPQNAFEVAVILETAGYDEEAAHARGARDVFDLARRVLEVADLYTVPQRLDGEDVPVAAPPTFGNATGGASRFSASLLLRCVLYSVPWLMAIVALAVSRVSFWSTITTIQFSSTISLALFVALIVTGAFIQAFARRGTFYALQGNRPLLWWTTRWTLGSAAVVTVAIDISLYLVLQYALRAYTPASDRAFLWFGMSISAMLIALSPLFMARAFGHVTIAAGAGAACVALGGEWITRGQYIYPYAAMRVQLVSIWLVVALAIAFDVHVLRRVPRATEAKSLEQVRPPRLGAVVASVTGYAIYGAGFFLLIIVDQLVAGGLWSGRFVYDNDYELAIGAGLLILVPTLTYVTATNEVFTSTVQAALASHTVTETAQLRLAMVRFYRRHLGVLVGVGLLSGAALLLLGALAASSLPITAALPKVYGLYAAALLAYFMLAVGALNSGLLFSVGRPTAPAVAVVAGALGSLLIGGALTGSLPHGWAAIGGLLGATGLFALSTTVSAGRMFARFDTSYYRAF